MSKLYMNSQDGMVLTVTCTPETQWILSMMLPPGNKPTKLLI